MNDRVRMGGEYFQAKNWNNTTTAATDKSDGFSVWGSFAVTPVVSVFGRYDDVDPSKDLRPALNFTYYNAGVQWRLNEALGASVALKHADVEGGTVSTSNGTIGSTVANRKGRYNEVGLWAIYDFLALARQ